MAHIGINATQRHCRADVVPLSGVGRTENRLAVMIGSASRFVRWHFVGDFLGGAISLLLWAALWSLFILGYGSPSADLDEGAKNSAQQRTGWERSAPEAGRYVTSEILKP